MNYVGEITEYFNRLKNNELVIIESITGNQIYISKSLFGIILFISTAS